MARTRIAQRILDSMKADNGAYGEIIHRDDGRIVIHLGVKPGTDLHFPSYDFPEGVIIEVSIVKNEEEWKNAVA